MALTESNEIKMLEAARVIGAQVAAFRSGLIESGVPAKFADELAFDFSHQMWEMVLKQNQKTDGAPPSIDLSK